MSETLTGKLPTAQSAEAKAFPPVVAVVATSPERVLDDYERLLHLAGYQSFLPKDRMTHLKINISWQKFYPACSTPPWQLEGVIRTLLADGYLKENLRATHNRTVVVNARVGELANKQRPVTEKYGIAGLHLYEKGVRWVEYKPKRPLLALPEIFPRGILIPEPFIGTNIIHLPTMKTHVFTTITGAMKNAFGGLLQERRHWTHSVIHETLVDLLTIQKEIHSGIFAVMDATVSGDGPGPRCMRPHITNYLLASADQVAIDAIAAKMMGFDPLSLDFIRLAHEKGLGCGDPAQIKVVGEDISQVNFHFEGKKDTFASRGQKLIYHGSLKPLENFLLRSPLVFWSYIASRLYHDGFWYPLIGRRRVQEFLRSDWGKLFLSY